MADEYAITDVGQDSARDLWYVQFTKPDGNWHTYWFPKSTPEWRAAEYGLDDMTEILDVILHEPFMEPEEERGATVESLLNPKAMTARAPAARPVTLWTAESTTEAREAHRDRVRTAKAKIRITVGSGDPLAVIRDRHGITADGVRTKREAVDTRRWVKKYGALPAAPKKETD